MEWSVADGASRYRATLEEKEGRVSIAAFSKDGLEMSPPNVIVSADEKVGRLIVEIDGSPRLAHAAKSGDNWWVHIDGRTHAVQFHEQGSSGPAASEGSLTAPMPGTIMEMNVKQGQRVREGQTLVVLEAMKMEHPMDADEDAAVSEFLVEHGAQVKLLQHLISIAPHDES